MEYTDTETCIFPAHTKGAQQKGHYTLTHKTLAVCDFVAILCRRISMETTFNMETTSIDMEWNFSHHNFLVIFFLVVSK